MRSLVETTARVITQVISLGRNTPVDSIHEKHGLYHLASLGSCNHYEWAKEILRLAPKQGRTSG